MSARTGSFEWWMAGIAVLWSAALLLADVPALAWLGVGWGAVVLVHRRFPVAAVAGSALLWGVCALAGVPETNAAALLPVLVAYFGAGRYLASWFSAALVPVGLVPLAAGPWHAGLPDYVFAALLYAAAWAAGRALRHRAGKAAQAWAVTRSLAGGTQGTMAAGNTPEAMDAFGGLTDGFFATVQEAIGRMREAAREARKDLDALAIEKILSIGSATVAELKEVVVFLRTPPGLELQAPVPGPSPRLARWVPAGYLLLVPLLGLDAAAAPGGFSFPAFGTGMLLAVACFAGRRYPVAGALAMAGLLAATAIPGMVLPEGLGTAAIYAVATWRLVAGTRTHVAAWLAMLAGLGVALWANAPWNIPVNAGVLALVAFASITSRRHGRDEDSARATAERLRAEFTGVLNAAVAGEGLALSTLVHDATSHSVGVLLIQANAAAALAGTDPDAARSALDVIETVGAAAQADLARLAADRALRERRYPQAELERLLAQLGGTGISVSVLRNVAPGARVSPELYKVAAEAVFNAARHAPGSSVRVRFHASALHSGVDVSNGPPAPGVAATPGSGQGLAGLERELAALGGSLGHGHTPDGGFLLKAMVPAKEPAAGIPGGHGPGAGRHAWGGSA